MKLDSKYFDRIRVKPSAEARQAPTTHGCEWAGCNREGTHKAPKGWRAEGAYHRFCIDHVKEYNRTYNFFDGMTDADVASFQEAAVTGHRPTWHLHSDPETARERFDPFAARKARAYARRRARPTETDDGDGIGQGAAQDPHGFFADGETTNGHAHRRARVPRNLEQKSLRILDLEASATPAEIKSRFKDLVKRHHPDSNGGDRGSEDRLREVIQAYNYLKGAGWLA